LSGGGMLKSSGRLALFTVLTAVSGLLADMLLAATFGLGMYTDAFYAAYTVPFFVANAAFVIGQATLVPIFSREADESGGDTGALCTFFNIAALAGGTAAALGAFCSNYVTSAVAPGMPDEAAGIAGGLAAVLFPVVLFSPLTEVLRSRLYSRGRFAYAASSNFVRNVVAAAGIFLLGRRMGITGAAVGFCAGYAAQFLMLAGRVFIVDGIRYRPVIDLKLKGFRDGVRVGAIQGAGFTVLQGVTFAERVIGSYLPPGSITALSYGSRIIFMIVETVSGSMATATLPELARAEAAGDREAAGRILRTTFRWVVMIFLPMTAFIVVLREFIITLLYRRGAFSPEAVKVTALVLMLYSLSLVFQGFNRLLHNLLFAAMRPAGSLTLFSVLAATAIAVDLLLFRRVGIAALPLGYLAGTVAAFALGMRLYAAEYFRA